MVVVVYKAITVLTKRVVPIIVIIYTRLMKIAGAILLAKGKRLWKENQTLYLIPVKAVHC